MSTVLRGSVERGTTTTGSWFHIALTRASGSTRLFVNGVQSGSTYADTNNYIVAASRPRIGQSVVGNMDEVRVIKGYAVWTSDFTPPTGPYL